MEEKVDEAIDRSISKMEARPDTSVTRMNLGEIGVPFLKGSGGFIQNEMRRELQAPHNLNLYDRMREDSAVASALNTAETFLMKALAKGKFITHSKKPEAKEFADFLNWNIRNLKDYTWWDTCTNIISYLQYGYSFVEKVYEKNYSTKFSKYPYKLKKLAPRSQHSVAQFEWAADRRTLLSIKQYPAQELNTGWVSRNMGDTFDYPELKRNKIMLFSWMGKNGSPQGTSPLNGCYRAWKEKTLIETIQVQGIAKGLNGIIELRMPTDHINAAAEDPESAEAKTLEVLKQSAALMHSGDQTFILLGSDTQGQNGNGKYVYDWSMKGVEGGTGETVSTTEFINERKKAILDVFSAGFINIGNEGVGSHSLADSKTSLHAFAMDAHLQFIKSVIENDLIVQLAQQNKVYLEESDMPIFEYGAFDDVDPAEFSAAIQRIGSVGLFPMAKSVLLDAWRKVGLDVADIEDLPEDEILNMLTAYTSRASEGKGSSGVGDSQSGGVGSSLNANNSA